MRLREFKNASEYIVTGNRYRLGGLSTEQPHPWTKDLSHLAKEDLNKALYYLHRVDQEALSKLSSCLRRSERLAMSIRDTLDSGGRLFLSGCGATGRLVILLETLLRQGWLENWNWPMPVAFMAGGDAALVRSLEGFEDFPEWGDRQLRELGFREGDLLVAVTEGGETPWVLGTVSASLEISSRSPWLLCCNPLEGLVSTVERSARILRDNRVRDYCMPIGPMAIAGSTRMQASTVLLGCLGWALDYAADGPGPSSALMSFRQHHQALSYGFLQPFIENEECCLRSGRRVLYRSTDYAMTVLTDTTERAPTFSVAPFENSNDADDPASHCYAIVPGVEEAGKAWEFLLHRKPRTLSWPEVAKVAGMKRLEGFDISAGNPSYREPQNAELFDIARVSGTIAFRLGGHSHHFGVPNGNLLEEHLVLKMLLNAHSTLLMCRMGRVRGNLMTHVRASNGKLIDRAARYVQILAGEVAGRDVSWQEAVRAVFAVKDGISVDTPVVEAALRHLFPDIEW